MATAIVNIPGIVFFFFFYIIYTIKNVVSSVHMITDVNVEFLIICAKKSRDTVS
jgi:hypothetical protein